ncbi:DUF3558 domain-containing protein [Nocardia sp. NPDC001965]
MRTAKKAHPGIQGKPVLAVMAFVLLTGCGTTLGGESAAGEANTATGGQQVEWNPCSDLPVEALTATGADPASKDTDFDAPGDRAAWKMCAWDAVEDPYYIGVGATTYNLDQIRANTSVTGFSPVQVNGRSGLQFHPGDGEQPIRRCYVSLPMATGALTVYTDWRYSERSSLPESPPCGLAMRHAQALEPYLPE